MSEFGLPQAMVATIRNILASEPVVQKAVRSGSRAKGTAEPGSDVDLALFGAGTDLDTVARLAGRLEESPIPYQVDLCVRSDRRAGTARAHRARGQAVLRAAQ